MDAGHRSSPFICYRWNSVAADLERISSGPEPNYPRTILGPGWDRECQIDDIPSGIKLLESHIIFWAEVALLRFSPADSQIEGAVDHDFRVLTQNLKVWSSPLRNKSQPLWGDADSFLKECISLSYDDGLEEEEESCPTRYRDHGRSYQVMIISTIDGIAYREDVVTLYEWEWKPEAIAGKRTSRKLIIMG